MQNQKKIFSFLVTLLAAYAIHPRLARAQFVGYTTPQSAQQTLATNLPCTGSNQIFKIQNLGQTQHYASIAPNSLVTTLVMQIQGVDASGNVYVISDTASIARPITGFNPSLVGTGYFPNVQISVLCLPAATGTFTLNYNGTSATSNQIVSSYLTAQMDKTIGSNAPANASYNLNFQTPFGNSFGTLYFEYSGAGNAGAELNVTCQTQSGTGGLGYLFFPATTTGVVQTFPVPAGSCPNALVQYIANGATASLYFFDYVFLAPGTFQTNVYTHVTGTSFTVIKGGPGILHSIAIGTPAAGTVSIYDEVPAQCAAMSTSNPVTVITAIASTMAPTYLYDVVTNQGICLKASVAMDITVSSQ